MRNRTDQISKYVGKVIEPVIRKYCTEDEYRLIMNWERIVGSELARLVIPGKVSYYDDANGKTIRRLSVRVRSGCSSVEVPYTIPLMIEKIAVYFGFFAVTDIKISC
jgi:hypothetical protein